MSNTMVVVIIVAFLIALEVWRKWCEYNATHQRIYLELDVDAPERDALTRQALDAIKAELLERKIKSEKVVEGHSRHDELVGDRECNFHRGYATAAEDVLEILNAKFCKENA